MEEPLISCLCPTKSDPETVKLAVQCFNDQSYPSKELILVTDEGNPHLEFLQTLVESNIKLFKAPSGSVLGFLRNMSVKNASGEYIATWDDDDVHQKHRLTEQYKAIKQSGKEACYLSNTIIKDKTTGTIGISKDLFAIDCTMLALKKTFVGYNDMADPNKIGGGVEDVPIRRSYLKQGSKKWDLIPSKESKLVYLQKPHLYVYNIHKHNTCDYRIQKSWIATII